jgi:two-component system phosphate regulon sensor histidine kinase PhoR
MPESRRKFIVGLVLFLTAGGVIGWVYDKPMLGALIAALLALIWQVRQLLAFDRALHTGDFDKFRYGEGIWQQIFSRFTYEHERGGRYKNQYRQVLKEIRKSTNAMPDGAVILDSNNDMISCNRAAKSLAGLKRKKDRGQRIDNILRDPDLTDLLRRDDMTQSIDIASPIKDGVWLNCRVVSYGADQKLLLLRDVTNRFVLNRMRRDFIANASHELRSPLTVISGYLDAMVDDEEVMSAWGAPVAQMRSQSRRMTQIVSEMLELSRLEGAGPASKEDVVDVAALLVAGRNAFQGGADAPTIRIEAESSALLRGDSGEIESVVINLLSNAIRHTPPQGVVTLTWRSASGGADLVVSDTGEGIAEEFIPRLTERFFRVDRGRAREDGGVGLGLAIVKHVLSRHDAEIRISSEPGSGSAFCCHFPPDRVISEPLS